MLIGNTHQKKLNEITALRFIEYLNRMGKLSDFYNAYREHASKETELSIDTLLTLNRWQEETLFMGGRIDDPLLRQRALAYTVICECALGEQRFSRTYTG